MTAPLDDPALVPPTGAVPAPGPTPRADTPPRWLLLLMLAVIGAGWGLTQPFSKIIVGAGRDPFGIVFWQLALGAVFLTLVQQVRRRPFRRDPRALRLYLVIVLLGTIFPNSLSYLAYRHLPSGVMSILISTLPMMAFALALALRADRFSLARFGGLSLGLFGIVLIVGPGGALMVPDAGLWVLVALAAPAFYAIEANYVAGRGIDGLGAIQLLHGASVVGALLTLPLALVTGQAFLPRFASAGPDLALLANSVLHALCYSLYVWVASRAGATFAAQVSYLVTGFGVLWAMAILGERYSAFVWLALLFVLAGVFLVQPRRKAALAKAGPAGKNAAV